MKRHAGYALACLTAIGVVLAVMWLVYGDDAARQAVLISAAVALVVQMLAFAAAFALARTNVMVGWGAGSLLRLATLVVYGLLIAPKLGLPATPALVSLATYLFLSMLIEPFFLKP